MRASFAWSVLSLIKTTIVGGTKLLVRGFVTIFLARRKVKKGRNRMEKNLIESGIARDTAREIADSYASLGNEVLSIRKLYKMARELDS